MTETISTPGVYTSEVNQSFIAPVQVPDGCAIVGPTQKGEAYVPTSVQSPGQFSAIFGTDTSTSYVPQTVYNYLQAGTSINVTRVLGNGGWQFNTTNKIAALVQPASIATSGNSASLFLPTSSVIGSYNAGQVINLIGDTSLIFYGQNGGSAYNDSSWSQKIFETSGSNVQTINNFANKINTYKNVLQITASYSGGESVVLSTINTGILQNTYKALIENWDGTNITYQSNFSGGTANTYSTPPVILSVFHPTLNTNPASVALNNSTIASGSTYGNFYLTLSGNQVSTSTVTASLIPSNANYISKVLGTTAKFQTGSAFPYLNFTNFQTSASLSNTSASLVLTSTACTFTSSYSQGYAAAATPWVITSTDGRLFQFVHRSHGFASNTDVKVAIQNIKVNTDPTIYTTFDVLVRAVSDTDKTPVILEQYTQVNLNPNDPKYIGLVIGDKYSDYDSNLQKVVGHGNFDNISNYIRVSLNTAIVSDAINPNIAPAGFEAVQETIAGFAGYSLPSASLVYSNTGSLVFSGFDYGNTDNLNYLNPVPLEATAGNNRNFYVAANDNKFMLPLQGGTDGMSYQTIKNIGSSIANTNVFGFDLSSNATAGYASFKQALDILSNKQQYKYGILVMPGVIEQYHGAVTAYAQAMVESRTDAVYLRDLTGVNESVPTAVTTAAGLDSSYSATYYPWVKVKDIGSSRAIHVPPTVMVPQAIAYNDRVGAPWFAVAGTGRGTLGGAIDVRNRLSPTEQGTLYNAKINPIIKTPTTGVVIWGQKTLQTANTALNRLNVRRLLIQLKDYISTIADDFVFEQNSNASRNSFISKVNPYLQSVQQNQGLTAYKLTCDATNNSNTDTANHILNVKIQIIPTESIEFILLEFDITSQGVSFV